MVNEKHIYCYLAKHHSPTEGFWLAKVRCCDPFYETIKLNEVTVSSGLKKLWKHLISLPLLFPCECYAKKNCSPKNLPSSFSLPSPARASSTTSNSLPKKHIFSLHCLIHIADNDVLGPPCSACAAETEQTSGIGTLGEPQVAKSSFTCLEFLELGTTDCWKSALSLTEKLSDACWSCVSHALLSSSY